MTKKRFFILLSSCAAMALGLDIHAQEARARYEMLNLIRKEKFDLILPKAMKDNNIDMWIHVMQRGDSDPLELDLGGTEGYFVFSDRAYLLIQPDNLIAFEFVVHTWIPELEKRLALNYEDSAIVTGKGIEALYPRN